MVPRVREALGTEIDLTGSQRAGGRRASCFAGEVEKNCHYFGVHRYFQSWFCELLSGDQMREHWPEDFYSRPRRLPGGVVCGDPCPPPCRAGACTGCCQTAEASGKLSARRNALCGVPEIMLSIPRHVSSDNESGP